MRIFAHRGLSAYYPENTILAFKEVIKIKGCAIEFDVQKTKDNKLVIIHDEDIQRTFKGKGLVIDYTLKELEDIQCRNPVFRNSKECKIVTLGQVIELIKDKDIYINIELKNDVIKYSGIERDVIDLICKNKMEDKTLLSSFNHNSLKVCKEINSNIKTGILFHNSIENIIEYTKKINADAVHPYIGLVNKEFVEICHENNILVNTYTVNEPNVMRQLIKDKVDGIFTDYPGLLEEILTENKVKK